LLLEAEAEALNYILVEMLVVELELEVIALLIIVKPLVVEQVLRQR
jgi:hypothetical protein